MATKTALAPRNTSSVLTQGIDHAALLSELKREAQHYGIEERLIESAYKTELANLMAQGQIPLLIPRLVTRNLRSSFRYFSLRPKLT